MKRTRSAMPTSFAKRPGPSPGLSRRLSHSRSGEASYVRPSVYHHVLCAYDGSPAAEAALAEAVDLASATRARLAIVTVIEKPAANVAAAGVAPAALAQTIEHDAGERLRAATDRVPDDVPLTTLLRTGHAGKQILKAYPR